MRQTFVGLVLFALVGCWSGSRSGTQDTGSWDAPPARWVSDLGRFDGPNTYNRLSSVSNGGRWVVFTSEVADRPLRIFLADTKKGTVRRIDDSYDGGPRTAVGVRRYNQAGLDPQITPDGRYVVFSSAFSNLVRRDRNDAVDIFVYDRITRKNEIVSRSSDGRQANLGSYNPAISADGRFVVFDSRASNLVADDRDHRSDVFRRELRTGSTELISVGARGKGNGWSSQPDISAAGNRISFLSDASNLVDDDTNDLWDVFVRDTEAAETVRASITSDGEQYETFESEESATVYRASVGDPQISGNGEVVAFAGKANLLVEDDVTYNDDIFVHELSTGVTERVSVRSDGGDSYGAGSVECGKDPVCSQFTGTGSPSVSHDGRLVYFLSAAPLISDEDDDDQAGGNEEQVFVRDRNAGMTLLVSRYRNGSPAHSTNWYPGAISASGRWVTYSNNSIRLDGPRGDQDPGPDVFLQRLP